MSEGAIGRLDLPNTPTWAVALFVAFMGILSFAMDYGMDKLSLMIKNKPLLTEALETFKAELIQMGFISLLLNMVQTPIAKICIPRKAGNIFLPCNLAVESTAGMDLCLEKGKVALISPHSMHQLHIFNFLLAVAHFICRLLTFYLARYKMTQWIKWESLARYSRVQLQNDLAVDRPISPERWIMALWRHFTPSYSKRAYMTIRLGFINAHYNGNSYDFYKYIKKASQEDFKVVIGISPFLRVVEVVMLMLNIHGAFFWISFAPLLLLLLVGAKMDKVFVDMVLDAPATIIKPSKKFYWLGRPVLALYFISVALFMHAFQMALFVWAVLIIPGMDNCYYTHLGMGIATAVLWLAFQFVCGYVTLPLCALVRQMSIDVRPEVEENFLSIE